MKAILLKPAIFVSILLSCHFRIIAQDINWNSVSSQNRNLLQLKLGAEYGVTIGLGYHYLVPRKKFPFWIGGEFSLPSGKQLTDDFKVRIGGQIRVANVKYFQFSAKLQGIARRYQNQSVRLFNFGSDMSGTIGYYRKHWFLGVEAGFDKAIVTHFKHSEWFRQNIYDKVQDGWYEPSTGGNFYYGLIGGYSLKKWDITIKGGRMLQQDFVSQPVLPFFGQVGLNYRF